VSGSRSASDNDSTPGNKHGTAIDADHLPVGVFPETAQDHHQLNRYPAVHYYEQLYVREHQQIQS
jgi:hypothetical protein